MIINSPYVSGSLTVSCNINVCGTINGTANICTSTLFASTRVCSPNLCATTTICGPAFVGGTMSGTTLYGSTAACAPTVFGTTAVCSPTIFASTVACAPTVFGTTAVCAPTVFGTTAVCSPTVFGTTVVCGGSVCTTGNICAAGSITGSAILSTGRITAQTLVVSTISSSVTFSSGSNIFGNSTANTQTMTGSVNITGSLTVTTTAPELTVSATGVTLGNVITDTHNVTGSLRTTGSITGVGNACFTSVCSPSYTGGTFSGTTIAGTTLYGSTTVCAPTICGGNVCGTVGCFVSVCSPTHIGGTFSGTTVSGTTLYGSTAICAPTILGTTIVSGSVGCFISICSPTYIGGTYSGTTNYASTIACSPIGCFATSCATSFIGGTVSGTTISGTTIYGSTNLCGPSVCTTDGFHCSLRMACRLIPFSNYRTSDCGYGGIDFFDNGKGYACSAKFYTFKTGTEYYGFTNDYNGNAQLAAVSCGGGGGENISFFTGTSTTARLRIDNNASCFSQTVCTPTLNVGRVGIGISSPSDPFYVCCLNSIITHNGAQGWSLFRMYACNNGVEFQIRTCVDSNQVSIGTFSNTCLKIRTNNTDRLLIDNTGIACFACNVCTAKLIANGGQDQQITAIGTEADIWMCSTGGGGGLWRLLGSTGSATKLFRIYDSNAGADRLNITTSGVVCILQGVRYGNGSTTLNYYEEGTWTPVLAGSSVAGTVTYAFRSASYVRIGNYVFVRWGFKLSSIAGASGTMRITGLPFTAVNWGSYQEPNVSVSTGLLATADYAQRARVYVEGGGTALQGRIANNADTAWDISEFGGDEWVIGEIFYNV